MTNAELIAEARNIARNLAAGGSVAEADTVRWTADALERTEAVAREAVLREALQDLMDWQNGPPLPSYETGWQEAHDRAQELLASPSPAAERLLEDATFYRELLPDLKAAPDTTDDKGRPLGRFKAIPLEEYKRLLKEIADWHSFRDWILLHLSDAEAGAVSSGSGVGNLGQFAIKWGERLLAQVKAAERLVQLTEMVAKADGWKDTDEMVLAVKAYRKQEGP